VPERCVIERWIGAAVGAVGVLGGTENVRIPRLPLEKPPPTRGGTSHLQKLGWPQGLRSHENSLLPARAGLKRMFEFQSVV
jgi:hypothetical protein